MSNPSAESKRRTAQRNREAAQLARRLGPKWRPDCVIHDLLDHPAAQRGCYVIFYDSSWGGYRGYLVNRHGNSIANTHVRAPNFKTALRMLRSTAAHTLSDMERQTAAFREAVESWDVPQEEADDGR